MLVGANPPAQAQQTMTADQQASLSTAIAAGDATTIASLAATLSGPALAALAGQLAATNNATLIAAVLVQVQTSNPGASSQVAGAVGIAVAASPNAITLAPAVVTQTVAAGGKGVASVFAGAVISTSTNGAVVAAVQTASAQADIVPVTVVVSNQGSIVVTPPPPVPPPCQTSCS
jgi:hypothetical protein